MSESSEQTPCKVSGRNSAKRARLLLIPAFLVLICALALGGREIIKLKSRLRALRTEVAALPKGQNLDQALLNEAALSLTLRHTVINDRDPVLTAQKLCNAVADNKFGAKPLLPGLPTKAQINEIWRSISSSREIPYYCGGASCVLMNLLEAAGLPARFVSGVTKTQYDGTEQSHVLVEFYDGAKWLLIDPSFNYMYQDSAGGAWLSLLELIERLEAGVPVTPVFLGGGVGYKGLKNSPAQMSAYMSQFKYWHVAAGLVFYPEEKRFPPEFKPADWDGSGRYADGKGFSLFRSGETYAKQCGGRLR